MHLLVLFTRKLIVFWLIINVFAMEDRVTPEKLILYFDQHSLNLVLFVKLVAGDFNVFNTD